MWIMLFVLCFYIASRAKKSNCVKEVEKIQQRRMERRAVHQAIREHQEQEYDVNSATWEFEAMIK